MRPEYGYCEICGTWGLLAYLLRCVRCRREGGR